MRDRENINNKNLDRGEDIENSLSKQEIPFASPDGLYKLKLEYSSEGIYALPGENMTLIPGDRVFVPTRYGKDIALVLGKTKAPIEIIETDIVEISRIVTKEDLQKVKEYIEKEKEAFQIFKEKVAYHRLDMKLVTTHFLLDEPKILFFFTSENRVDFRELVKDLVSVFKMRIELRQIGVRDEARIIGGLGVCGRPFCCNAVSDKLKPVSIRMAKDQNLSLNSMKISGQCGRLLCCLAYEHDWYAESRKKLPHEGVHIYYDKTNFKVTDVNLITAMVSMHGEDGRILEVAASRFVKQNGRWHIT
ncbi:MAG TPA: regulatory iron-sulfur-containing complex subunit RicT [Treponemataceae bacterium]|nr:regulatory iron-sulfur-containing complex subunit RicT [Treponemataceae bacterium]